MSRTARSQSYHIQKNTMLHHPLQRQYPLPKGLNWFLLWHFLIRQSQITLDPHQEGHEEDRSIRTTQQSLCTSWWRSTRLPKSQVVVIEAAVQHETRIATTLQLLAWRNCSRLLEIWVDSGAKDNLEEVQTKFWRAYIRHFEGYEEKENMMRNAEDFQEESVFYFFMIKFQYIVRVKILSFV